MLADSAQEVNGKLYILGGGWSVTGPEVGPMALAIKIDVPWNSANRKHRFEVALLGEDGHPPEMVTPDGHQPGQVSFRGEFEVGRPPGIPPGSDIDATFAVQLAPLPLVPGRRYLWRVEIDGTSEEHWQRAFFVREQPPSGTRIRQ